MGPSSDKTIAHGNLKNRAVFAARNFWSGLLFGLGFMAFATVTAFHQLLQWHHFYDLSTHEVALIADGFFQAFGWFITIWGLFLLADIRRRTEVAWTRWSGAVITGVGTT